MNTQNTQPNGSATPELRVKREEQQPKLVTFGRGGATVYFSKWSQLQTYDSREQFFKASKWWAHNYETIRDVSQYEGVPFCDKTKAVESDAGFKFAIRGPMVNVDLPTGKISECPQPSEFLAAGVSEEFKTLLAMQVLSKARKVKAGPLDEVSISEYLDGWREYGATIGTIRNGKFVSE